MASLNCRASPWIESTDPYLRSNLQLLVSNHILRVPTNTFPIPWRLVGEQIQQVDQSQLNKQQQYAFEYVAHFYNNARLNRGSKQLQLLYSEVLSPTLGFAPSNRDKVNALSSYEHTGGNLAYRLVAHYQEDTEHKKRLSAAQGFASVNFGFLILTAGQMEHWWGSSWGQALAWGQKAEPLPSLTATIFWDSSHWLGSGLLETSLSRLDNPLAYKYLWSGRVATILGSACELGISHQATFSAQDDSVSDRLGDVITDSNSDARRQSSIDARIHLPKLDTLYPSIYTAFSSTSEQTTLQTSLYGLDLQFASFGEIIHLIFETQKNHKAYNGSSVVNLPYAIHRDRPINDSHLPSHWTLGALIQLHNDHAVQAYLSYFDQEQSQYKLATMQYQFQWDHSLIKLGINVNSQDSANRINSWISFSYRL